MNIENNIKAWYKSKYPEDNLGNEINNDATFVGFNEDINIMNAYHYIGVFDSFIRERVFAEISERTKIPYEVLYKKWLSLP
jgi:hypothetical protein